MMGTALCPAGLKLGPGAGAPPGLCSSSVRITWRSQWGAPWWPWGVGHAAQVALQEDPDEPVHNQGPQSLGLQGPTSWPPESPLGRPRGCSEGSAPMSLLSHPKSASSLSLLSIWYSVTSPGLFPSRQLSPTGFCGFFSPPICGLPSYTVNLAESKGLDAFIRCSVSINLHTTRPGLDTS